MPSRLSFADYLSRQEFADKLGVNRRDVYGAIRLGLIKVNVVDSHYLIHRRELAKCKVTDKIINHPGIRGSGSKS
jgi:hypothetical protein